jgi:hypothetical protein
MCLAITRYIVSVRSLHKMILHTCETSNLLLKIIIYFELLIILGFNFYSLVLNNTNHCGFDTFILVPILILITIVAIRIYLISKDKRKENQRKIIFLVAFCIFVILNIILYEKFNIMMKYELWLDKGMPNKFGI